MEETTKTVKLQKLCIALYGIYALSIVLQFAEETLLLGLFALIIAYILASSKRDEAKDTPYASHIQWLIRTFWIGSAVIMPIAVIISTALIMMTTDIVSIATSMSNGDPAALMTHVQTYMTTNMTKVSLMTMATMIPTVAWWLRRCWIGYTFAKSEKPVDNVKSWL